MNSLAIVNNEYVLFLEYDVYINIYIYIYTVMIHWIVLFLDPIVNSFSNDNSE